MATPKFNFSLGKEQREAVEKAASILGVDKAEIVRIGAFQFAKLVIEGKLDKAIIEQIGGIK